MKRSWFSILAVVGVMVLLTLFLGLQYKWLSEVTEAERERMQKRVEADTARLAEDFNREMQAAYYNFQTDADVWKTSNWIEFNERYDFWKERTKYPELIRDIYFVDKRSEIKPLRYDTEKRSFEASAISADLESLIPRFTDDKKFQPVYKDAYAMVVPIHESEGRIERVVLRRTQQGPDSMMRMPEKFGWLVVLLDESIIKTRILPELASKYFPDGDYRIAVLDKINQPIFASGEITAEGDASAAMFDLSPDNLLFFANRDALPRSGEPNRRAIVVNERVESHTFSTQTNKDKTGMFKIEMQGPGDKGKPRTAMFARSDGTGDDHWTLRVQHNAGSIGAFSTNERNKSFAIGLGLYFLLVGGIMAIVLSAMRSRRFAQRQIDFVSSVSHEFRTPLAVIYSAGENLADGVANEGGQIAQYGALIKGEGKKLADMVEQILEFAGAGSGKQKYSFAPVDIDDVVRDALSACRPLIESGGFVVDTDLQKDLPAISGDTAALSTAIQNLIANSVKYSNGSSWIRISTANGAGSIRIVVEDRGIGITRGELREIFEPFYRSKQVVDAQISGNGLGLNLVKKIVEAHGGKVSVESTMGSGSKFTIELPQAPE